MSFCTITSAHLEGGDVMEEMTVEIMEQVELPDAEEKIQCVRCEKFKGRGEFRKVPNPKICLECYSAACKAGREAAKRKKHQDAETSSDARQQDGSNAQVDSETKNARATIHLTVKAQSILNVLALKSNSSQSSVVEEMLKQRYAEMDDNERQFVAFVETSLARKKHQ
jgi:hypothetical protein